MKSNKIVYTCITGNYDEVPCHDYIDKNWDYVLFTDNQELIAKGRIHHWTVRPLVYNKSNNVKNARWHKVNAYLLFPDYEYSLWIDANVRINNKNVFDKCANYIKTDILIAVPKHPLRNCIYDEAKEVISLNIDSAKTVARQMRILKRACYPKQNGLAETNILFRQHNKLIDMQNLWWEIIYKFSKRDQLSFNYALWCHGISYVEMYSGTHRDCGDFTFLYKASHNQDKIKMHKFKLFDIKIYHGHRRLYFCGICILSYKILNNKNDKNNKPILKNLLIYTYANEKFYDFAILYPIWALYSNKDTCIEIALENKRLFYNKYRHLIEYYNQKFPGLVKFTQVDKKFKKIIAGTIRFVSKPQCEAKYLYIGDIDILILEDICKQHIKNIEQNNLDYSNIKRRNQDKLSGLHFIEFNKMYPLDLTGINLLKDNDENVLYKLMHNKKYTIPDENTQSFRPLCGIHISYFSRPPLKALTFNDAETNFPCWYDNCNNEKLSYEIDLYNKIRDSNHIRRFYSEIKDTDIDLRRLIQIIDLFLYYLSNNRNLLN